MKWTIVVRRKLSPLFFFLITKGQIKKEFKKLFNLDSGLDLYRGFKEGIFYSTEELDEVDQFIRKQYKKQGTKIFKDLLKKWQFFMKDLEKQGFEISKKDYSNYTNKELLKEFDRLDEKYHKLGSALYFPVVIERLANDLIKEHLPKEKEEEYFIALTTTEKENEGTKELESSLKIAVKYQKGEDITEDIKKHIKEFGWINTRGFYKDEWTEKEVLERIKELENPEQRLKQLENFVEEVKEKTNKIFNEINADKNFKDFVKTTKEYVSLRTERMDSFVKAGFYARQLFKEIAKRLNLTFHELINLIPPEIKQAFEGKDFSKEIKAREKEFGYVRNGEKFFMLTGKELQNYKKDYLPKESLKNIKEIKGNIASPGKVKGKVKVVITTHEMYKVKKGDILVASMTIPQFVPAMEKAAAFVTDEGGILCHAAIVSREMNKPCIIGTKIATKVLKDGDLVEVDADKGIIRKL